MTFSEKAQVSELAAASDGPQSQQQNSINQFESAADETVFKQPSLHEIKLAIYAFDRVFKL